MSNVVKLPFENKNLEELMKVLDTAHGHIENLSMQLLQMQEQADIVQESYDREVKALAHRLGGMENVPVEYLLYTTLDSGILEVIEKRLSCEATS